ncbi:hypothetical protein X801_06774 [Opisthorchis viverrini]|uniref:Uncharacterized protein n=1 Tax=Opisthorchis viverrini TaxID=6198 RepID=A0A1S8WSF7_OPIVI|nr:hypothetical protein X801_06774 [Opisthorchis viverrini]
MPIYADGPMQRLRVMSIGFLVDQPDTAVVWRGPRKSSMIETMLNSVCWGQLDCLVIDTPPGTSDEHLTVLNQIQQLPEDKVAGAVIVSTPQCIMNVIVLGAAHEVHRGNLFREKYQIKTVLQKFVTMKSSVDKSDEIRYHFQAEFDSSQRISSSVGYLVAPIKTYIDLKTITKLEQKKPVDQVGANVDSRNEDEFFLIYQGCSSFGGCLERGSSRLPLDSALTALCDSADRFDLKSHTTEDTMKILQELFRHCPTLASACPE